MVKRILLWITTVFMGAFFLFSMEAVMLRGSLADKTLRLHVVAHSDSPEDQAQKLRLRDHILGELYHRTKDCSCLEEAEGRIGALLPELQETAEAFLAEEGSAYNVSVSLCTESFETRQYDTFALPPGEYRTLRIVIGEGQGKNWWCVVFPTLCNAADPKELKRMALEGGYHDGELELIRREEPKYKLQFKVLEWLRELFR